MGQQPATKHRGFNAAEDGGLRDRTGGLDHFPHNRIIAPRESFEASRGMMGKVMGCLPQRWPIWFKPELVTMDGPAVGPYR